VPGSAPPADARPGCASRLVRGCSGVALAAILGFAAFSLAGNEVLRALEDDAPSRSIGTRSDGALVAGRRLPSFGPNFRTYSPLGSTLGRTAVHHRVRDTLLAAWASLAETHPDVTWQYGETGWPGGGPFWPHLTHRHGLSVDHMVPVRRAGSTGILPCRPYNALCYASHADARGDFGAHQLDFEALAALLAALADHAPRRGLGIDLVIFAPDLQDDLARAPGGAAVVRRLRFSTRAAWVRHDNHVHVDFRVR
jgi:penicillin-insensitive murein endopeptidase